MWNQKLRELRRLEREVIQGLCTRWREHFQTVLNHEEPLSPPEGEPNDELNIRAGRITRIEIEDAIKKNTGRLQDATIYHLRQLRREGTRQRRCF